MPDVRHEPWNQPGQLRARPIAAVLVEELFLDSREPGIEQEWLRNERPLGRQAMRASDARLPRRQGSRRVAISSAHCR